MPTLTANLTASGYGRSFAEDQSVTTDNGWDFNPLIPAAVAGSLTARTDNDTGSATLATGHGIVDADKVDVYWTGGSRRYMTVGTVAGDVVPLDGGTGDNLPVLTTALTVAKVNHEGAQAIPDTTIEGITLVAGTAAATFVLRTSANAELMAVVLPAGQSYIWTINTGLDSPVATGTVAKISITHAGSVAARVGGAVYYN